MDKNRNRRGDWASAILGLVGMALVGLGILWFLAMQFVAWRVSTAPTFDSAAWAFEQCRLADTPFNHQLTTQERTCLAQHEANAPDEAAAPWRRLSFWSVLPFVAGFMLLIVPVALHRFHSAPASRDSFG